MKKWLILAILGASIFLLAFNWQNRFWRQSPILEISENEITLRGGERIYFDEETLVVFFDSNASGWSGASLSDWNYSNRYGYRVVQQWLDNVIPNDLVTLGSIEDIEIETSPHRNDTIIGRDQLATAIIIRKPREPRDAAPIIFFDANEVNLLGTTGARGQEWWTYVYFPTAIFDLEQLSEEMLLNWIADHEGIFIDFESARIDLTNGHQLRLSAWNIRYFIDGESAYLGYFEEGQFIWLDTQTGESVPSPLKSE